LLHLTLTILLGIIASCLGAITYYALKRINNYEIIILNINDTIENIKHQLKLIDDKGHFESDDEVGFFFDGIKQLGEQLEELFETEVDDEEEKKEEQDIFRHTSS
jgi:glutaredoxin-related protein